MSVLFLHKWTVLCDENHTNCKFCNEMNLDYWPLLFSTCYNIKYIFVNKHVLKIFLSRFGTRKPKLTRSFLTKTRFSLNEKGYDISLWKPVSEEQTLVYLRSKCAKRLTDKAWSKFLVWWPTIRHTKYYTWTLTYLQLQRSSWYCFWVSQWLYHSGKTFFVLSVTRRYVCFFTDSEQWRQVFCYAGSSCQLCCI